MARTRRNSDHGRDRREHLRRSLPGGTKAGMISVKSERDDLMAPTGSIDEICVNTIRTLCIDAVQKAKSGHPGTPMGMAPVVYTLWQECLGLDSEESISPQRER